LRKYVQAAPNTRLAHLFLGIAADLAGDRALAAKEITSSNIFAGSPQFARGLEAAYASGGYARFLQVWASTTEQLVAAGRAQPASLAMMYARSGQKEKAFEWLEKSVAARSRALVLLRTEPQFDPLRGDPRFDDLVRRVGIPERAPDMPVAGR
jgi:hypothetical protein